MELTKLLCCFIACGLSVTAWEAKGRIVGGEWTRIADVPYQLSLRFDGEHICGASLITASRALTAAKCRDPSKPLHKYSVMAGSMYLKDDDKAEFLAVSGFIVHPTYKQTRSKYFDIAVLWLENDFHLSAVINVLALPEQDEDVPVEQSATVSGWGSVELSENDDGIYYMLSPVLQTTQIMIHHNMACDGRSLLRSAIASHSNDQVICAGNREGDGGVCFGDEGGALIVDGVQVGIVSHAGGCARPNFLATHTRVSSFIDWINSEI